MFFLSGRGIDRGTKNGTIRPCYGLLRQRRFCFSFLEGYRSRYNLRYKPSLLWASASTRILFFLAGGVYLKVQKTVQTGPALAVVPHHELYFMVPMEVQKTVQTGPALAVVPFIGPFCDYPTRDIIILIGSSRRYKSRYKILSAISSWLENQEPLRTLAM